MLRQRKHKSGFSGSDDAVDRIIRRECNCSWNKLLLPTFILSVTVQTGMITAVCAIIDLIVFLSVVSAALFQIFRVFGLSGNMSSLPVYTSRSICHWPSYIQIPWCRRSTLVRDGALAAAYLDPRVHTPPTEEWRLGMALLGRFRQTSSVVLTWVVILSHWHRVFKLI
jgi:hypothetical protein